MYQYEHIAIEKVIFLFKVCDNCYLLDLYLKSPEEIAVSNNIKQIILIKCFT